VVYLFSLLFVIKEKLFLENAVKLIEKITVENLKNAKFKLA
jgi:hypothetical protein